MTRSSLRRRLPFAVRWRVPAIALLAASCALGGHDPLPPPPDALRVLFVGNSLTYVNDVPRTVADLAESAGERACYCVAIAFPNYSLGDHLFEGEALALLSREKFDFVVLQQGPSALATSRDDLIASARTFQPFIEGAGARAVFYSVWPQQNRQFDFEAGRDSYRAAAQDIGGILAPAGIAWLKAWDRDFTLPLYSSDGLHASSLGSYLAALVLFQRLYDRSPVGVQSPARVAGSEMPWDDALVQLLQEAAADANVSDGFP